MALELFAATSTASEGVYEATRQAINRRFPDEAAVPSHATTQGLVERISGVIPIKHDMCHNSCVAYTGPYAILETCPECGASRYDPIRLAASHGRVKVPQQTFSTMPVGPQLQALYRHPDAARAMAYRSEKTKELLKKVCLASRALGMTDNCSGRREWCH
uniref:Uncharacterized protein n=1 Tax=Schizophyllum commune (strain H4-8 / FGSC 9210) TaxID=578458 RepID=D8PTF2_SCHCM